MTDVWYVGDPCYVIPEDRWLEFCNKTWDANAKINGEECGMDSIIEWDGHRLEIWSNGGDGSWEFNFEGKTIPLNGFTAEFGVDAGIFCIIPFEICGDKTLTELQGLGIVFLGKPTLHVEDNVVYINDVHDNSMRECWNCDTLVSECDEEYCESGDCVGCSGCFECECEE